MYVSYLHNKIVGDLLEIPLLKINTEVKSNFIAVNSLVYALTLLNSC